MTGWLRLRKYHGLFFLTILLFSLTIVYLSPLVQATNGHLFQNGEGWQILHSQDRPFYNISEPVILKITSLQNGQPKDLTNLTLQFRNETSGVNNWTLLNHTLLGPGHYEINFTLPEDVGTYFWIRLNCSEYPLSNWYPYWRFLLETEAEANPNLGYQLNVEYSPRSKPLQPGDLVTIWANITYPDVPYDPDDFFLRVYSHDDGYGSVNQRRIDAGIYRGTYRIPSTLTSSTAWEISAWASNDAPRPEIDLHTWDHFYLTFYQVWNRWVEVGPTQATLEMGVTDIFGKPIPKVLLDLRYEYFDPILEERVTALASHSTDSNGLTKLTFNYPMDSKKSLKVTGWANGTYSQELSLMRPPRESTYPRLKMERVGGHGNASGEDWLLEYKVALEDRPLSPGESVRVLVFNEQKIIEIQNRTIDNDGRLRIWFNPPPCQDVPYNYTRTIIQVYYWNGSTWIGKNDHFPIHDQAVDWGPFIWDEIQYQPVNEQVSILIGEPTVMELQLPAGLRRSGLGYSSYFSDTMVILEMDKSNEIGSWQWNRPDAPNVKDDPGWTFNFNNKKQYLTLYLPPFLEEANETFVLYLNNYYPHYDYDAHRFQTFALRHSTLPPPPPPSDPEPEDTSGQAITILVLLALLSILAFLGGCRREANQKKELQTRQNEQKRVEEKEQKNTYEQGLMDHNRWRGP